MQVPLIVSHPKSGRTWLRYFLSKRGAEVEFTHAGTATTRREIGRRVREVDVSLSHGRKTVFLYRNPIDTAISLFFHVNKKSLQFGSKKYFELLPRLLLERRLPPRSMARFLKHPGFGVEKICRFNAGWLASMESHPDVMTLSYDEARTNTEAAFTRLLEFLGEDTGNIRATIEASSFSSMKKKEQGGLERDLRLRIAIPGDPDSAKVRRGKVKGYVDYLDDRQIEKYRSIAARYGFEA